MPAKAQVSTEAVPGEASSSHSNCDAVSIVDDNPGMPTHEDDRTAMVQWRQVWQGGRWKRYPVWHGPWIYSRVYAGQLDVRNQWQTLLPGHWISKKLTIERISGAGTGETLELPMHSDPCWYEGHTIEALLTEAWELYAPTVESLEDLREDLLRMARDQDQDEVAGYFVLRPPPLGDFRDRIGPWSHADGHNQNGWHVGNERYREYVDAVHELDQAVAALRVSHEPAQPRQPEAAPVKRNLVEVPVEHVGLAADVIHSPYAGVEYQRVGEIVYRHVLPCVVQPYHVQRVTGMMMELPRKDVDEILRSHNTLQQRLREALDIIDNQERTAGASGSNERAQDRLDLVRLVTTTDETTVGDDGAQMTTAHGDASPTKRRMQLYDPEIAAKLMSQWLPPLAQDVEVIDDLKQVTIDELKDIPHLQPEDVPDVVELWHFTDGSGGAAVEGSPATWGFCTIARTVYGEIKFAGYQGGCVVTDPAIPVWVGAGTANSDAGEASAITWAMLWTMEWIGAAHRMVAKGIRKLIFGFDSTSVGGAIFWQWAHTQEMISYIRWPHLYDMRWRP